jgi:PPOX class probable F420-dependent enzyme
MMAAERDRVAMSPAEVDAFLAQSAKMMLATVNRDGTPHLVAMFYGMRGGKLAFWTYRSSQKARNLARDPRLSCLVEDGSDYFELRGVQVAGVVEPIEEPERVAEVGALIAARMAGTGPAGAEPSIVDEYVARAAGKRLAYVVHPHRIASWDHRKLLA